MNQNSPSVRGLLFSLVLGGAVLTSLPVRADTNLAFNLEVVREVTSTLRFNGGAQFYGLGASLNVTPAPAFDYLVISPNDKHNTRIGPGGGSGGGWLYSSLAEAVEEATNGLWRVILRPDGPGAETNYFVARFTQPLTNTDFSDLSLLNPLDGAENVSPTTSIDWTAAPAWDAIELSLWASDYNPYYFNSLPPGITTWSPPDALPEKPYDINLYYRTNAAAWLTFTAPTNAAGVPLAGWAATSQLQSRKGSRFYVGPRPALRTHLRFDDSGFLGLDSSPNENHAGSAWFTGPPTFSAAGIDGGAAHFFTADGGWIEFSPAFSPVLNQDFTVSVWVKTTNFFGSDSDTGDLGAGLVSGHGSGLERNAAPIVQVGGKAAFLTGNPDATLHSTTNINDGIWTHVAVTRVAATGQRRIYVNGLLSGTDTDLSGALNVTEPIRVGVNFGGGVFFEGFLDDLQIYAAALGESDVLYLFENPGSEVTNVISGGLTLAEALDAPGLTWSTGGEMAWFPQTAVTHDGADAAQSGALQDDESSYLETTVTGPGTLRFYWKVSSESGADYLELRVDGEYYNDISGDNDWEFSSLPLPPGPHTIRWIYSKDGSIADGADAAWLDEVSFSPLVDPQFTRLPATAGAYPGYDVALEAEVYANPEPGFIWRKGGVPVAGQTNGTFILTSPVPVSAAGLYQVCASNSQGVNCANAGIFVITDFSSLPPEFILASKPAGTSGDFGYDVATDANGNVFLAAGFYGTNDYGPLRIINNSGSENAVVVKFNPSGQPLWARHLACAQFSLARRLETDAAGNVYAVGWAGANLTVGGLTLTNAGQSDGFLVKFDPAGNVLWGKNLGSSASSDYAFSVGVDPTGIVTVGGLGGFYANGGPSLTPTNGQRAFVAQFSAAGAPRWAQTFSGLPWGMVTHPDGSVFVTGVTGEDPMLFDGVANPISHRNFLMRVSPTGSLQWFRNFGPLPSEGNPNGYGDDSPLVTLASNRVFVTAYSYGPYASFPPQLLNGLNYGEPFGYLASYDTNGTVLNTRVIGGRHAWPVDISGDEAGNVFVSGTFQDAIYFDDHILARRLGYETGLSSLSGRQGFIAKFNASTAFQWARPASGDGMLCFNGVAARGGVVWGGGFFAGHGSLSGLSLTSTPNTTANYTDRSALLARIGGSVVLPVQLVINATGSSVQITYASQTGASHVLEAAPNLTAPVPWGPVSTNTGNGSLQSFIRPITGVEAQFYRVRSQ